MSTFLAVGCGATIGACGRFFCTTQIQKYWQTIFPIATFCINLVGAFLIGFFMHLNLAKPLQLFFTTGIMGGFTTFSTFQSESLSLLQNKHYALFIIYQLFSWLGCLFTCWLGWQFTA